MGKNSVYIKSESMVEFINDLRILFSDATDLKKKLTNFIRNLSYDNEWMS